MFAGLCAKQQLQGGASRGFSEIAELLVLLFFTRLQNLQYRLGDKLDYVSLERAVTFLVVRLKT